MKIRHKLLFAAVIAVLFISCSSIGQHLPLSSDEIVIGTVQTTFIARDTWLANKKSINAQIYIKLLEAAVQKYPGDVDIRDMVWATGRKVDPVNTEVSATAKVIRVDSYETKN